MKVIMFAKQFPVKHPRQGESTYFVQKILYSLLPPGYEPITDSACPAKYHSIRAGNRWRVGETFSARVWSDLPYRSKQVEFAQIEIKQVIPVMITGSSRMDMEVLQLTDKPNEFLMLSAGDVAMNDGLDHDDFAAWFSVHHKKKRIFMGQIISWVPNLYSQ